MHEGPTLAPGRTDRARRGHRQGPAELPQQLPGYRGVSGRRRSSRRAIHAADRRHLLHQPLVLHGRVDPEASRAHRPGRRGRQLSTARRAPTPRARNSATASASTKARKAFGKRPSARENTPSTRRRARSCWCPPPTSSCTGSRAAPKQHHYDDTLKSIELITCDAYEPTLPLSVVVHIDYEKAPSVIQRFGDVKQLITQTLDPLLSALFPRRGPQEEHVAVDPRSRRDPTASAGGIAEEVPAIRHRVRRRAHRPAREQGGRHEDRDPARTVAAAAIRHRAGRDVPEAAGSRRSGKGAERGHGPGPIAGRVDEIAGADQDFGKHRRRRIGQSPQTGRNHGRSGRGRRQAGQVAGRRRGRRGCSSWPRPRPSRPR